MEHTPHYGGTTLDAYSVGHFEFFLDFFENSREFEGKVQTMGKNLVEKNFRDPL